MTPLYGWAPRAERASGRVPRNRGQNTTILAALGTQGVQAALTLDGAADRLAFEVFIEVLLVPTLRPGQIVIMDNLNIHKSAKARAAVEAAGCRWEYLPTYSPDMNPIESGAPWAGGVNSRHICVGPVPASARLCKRP